MSDACGRGGIGGGGDPGALKPGENIRPQVGPSEAQALAAALYDLSCTRVNVLNAYDDRNFHLQVPEDSSYKTTWIHGYVLKVLNAFDSRKPEIIEAQNEMMLYLGTKGIVCTQPVKNIHGKYYSREIIRDSTKGDEGQAHIVRLLTFQPGEILYNVPCTPKLMFEVGQFIANFNMLLKGFHHSAYENHKTTWMLEAVPNLKSFMYVLDDISKFSLAAEVIDVFEKEVLPFLPSLEKGLLHGDFNEQNILVQNSNNEWHVHGVIDLGDSHISCYVFELAITICYMMLQSKLLDPLNAGGHVIAGYMTKRNIPKIEFQLLKRCICARLCQSLVMGAYSYQQDPSNQYLLITSLTGWALLRNLWNVSEEELHERWNTIIKSYL